MDSFGWGGQPHTHTHTHTVCVCVCSVSSRVFCLICYKWPHPSVISGWNVLCAYPVGVECACLCMSHCIHFNCKRQLLAYFDIFWPIRAYLLCRFQDPSCLSITGVLKTTLLQFLQCRCRAVLPGDSVKWLSECILFRNVIGLRQRDNINTG